jgi:hypothetical protein
MISIKAVDGEVTVEVGISRETLEDFFGLDGNDSHAVLRAIDKYWEAIQAAGKKGLKAALLKAVARTNFSRKISNKEIR